MFGWRLRGSGTRTALRELLLLCIGILVGVVFTQFLAADVHCPKTPLSDRISDSVRRGRAESEAEPAAPVEKGPSTPVTAVGVGVENGFKIRTHQEEVHSSVKRPRTWKEELKPRKQLYVGVMTARKFLHTRAKAVNNTWGKQMPKLEFYVAPGPPVKGLSIVALPDVDDTYPPQRKVYRMLQHMHDHYIDKFNWFLRADDDVYIRTPELLEFLTNLDPSEDLYIGSPGMGRKEDLERIKLMAHERYCMGGPGVIMSRSLLKKLVPHLEYCLTNVVVSWNEDLELGRCISRRVGVQCTWSYQMRKMFFMDYSKGQMFQTSDVYKDKVFVNAITAHPFKDPDMMMRVHQFYLEHSLKKQEKVTDKLKKELARVSLLTHRSQAF